MLHHGDYREVLAGIAPVDLIVTSPPYNIGSAAPRSDGARGQGLYDPKSFGGITSYEDALPEEEYQQSQRDFLVWCAEHITETGLVVYNHKLRHKRGAVLHPLSWFPEVLDIYDVVVWDRGGTHNHCQSYLYQQTERLYVLKRKGITSKPYIDRTELQGDVWRIPIMAGRRVDRCHDAAFPLEIPRRAIRLWCPPDGVVCDPYSGSGTTMVAAYLEKRSFVGSELSLDHWKNACNRLYEISREYEVSALVEALGDPDSSV